MGILSCSYHENLLTVANRRKVKFPELEKRGDFVCIIYTYPGTVLPINAGSTDIDTESIVIYLWHKNPNQCSTDKYKIL